MNVIYFWKVYFLVLSWKTGLQKTISLYETDVLRVQNRGYTNGTWKK